MKKATFFHKLWLAVAIGVFLIQIQAGAQDINRISGVVVDSATGAPLPGATIGIQGTNAGTVADADGKFSLSVTEGQIMQASIVGYQHQTIVYSGQTQLQFKLSGQSTALTQVVVVGYGTQSRATITNSVAKLDEKVFQNAPRSNIGSALQGTLPGLQVTNRTGQPGAGPSVLLRGGASINNPGGPLVVVDGVIRSYNDIPSEDVESIQLLKDAAATAIYGARANNGVLLITTKHGKAGKAQISYKFISGYNMARTGYGLVNTKDYIYYNRLGNFNSGRSLSEVNSLPGVGLANSNQYDIRMYDGSTSHLLSQGWDTVGDPYGGTIIFKDHSGELTDLLYRNTHTQEHYVSATGGNEKGTYFSSFDYYKEDGILVGTGYKRFSGSVNGSYKILPNVEIGSGVNLSTSTQTGQWADIVTYWNQLSPATFNPWLDSAKTMPSPGNGQTTGNPLYWLGKKDRSNEVNNISGQASVKWDILSGLYVKGTGAVHLNEGLNQSFQMATQTYAQMFSTPPSPGNTTREAFAGFRRDFQQQYNVIVNYTKSLGKHDLTAMLGAEYFDTKMFAMQVMGLQAPMDDIPTVNASTIFNPNSSSDPDNPNNNYSLRSAYRILSQFGRLNYDYDQKYLLTLVFRRDGVSSLPDGHQFGFFPGLSAGWNIHKEQFFINSNITRLISTLKPRISYGVNGNVAGLGNYEVQGLYNSQGLYNGNAGFLNTGIANPNLRWEKSKTTDFGLDVGLLEDRITLIMDYYDRITSGLLTDLPLPSYTGFNSVRTNLGTFQNKGYEFTINANIIDRPEGLKWSIGANASYNENKILKLPPNGQLNNRQGGMQIYDPKGGRVVWVGGYQEGQTLGAVYAFKQLGIFKDQAEVAKIAGSRIDLVAGISGPNSTYGHGKIDPGDVNWLDVDKNDTIDTRDQVYIGNINPKWTGGFSTTLSYKGLSLYSRFQYAIGHIIYNDYVARSLGNYVGFYNYIDWVKRSWTPTNTNTDIPKVYYADQVSAPLGKQNFTRINNANRNLNSNNSHFYENGSYLACREITISYDLPQVVMTKTKVLDQLRVYTSLNNLFYITDFSGPTPEPPVGGINTGPYPTPRSFVLGVEASF